jgi:ABC-type branched-subunit amino acid transport system substrate-binding protein
MQKTRRMLGLVILASLFAGACTANSTDSGSATDTTVDSSDGGVGNTTGLTDTTVKVSMISADLSQLTEQNLAPEIGNAEATMKAVVADINARGGVAGRQIELVSHVIKGADAILNPDLGRQACVQATEDDKPFAVIITASIPAALVQCVAADHDVLTITMDSWPTSLYEAAKGRLFSLGSHISMERNREYRAWPGVLDDAGLLEGKTLGVIRTDAAEQQETTDGSLIPAIEALGYEVAAEAVLPCPEGSQTCDQHDVAIQRMQDAGVDTVFLVAQTLAGAATVEKAQTLGYKPQWTTIGNNVTNTVAKFYANAKENFDGAYGIDTQFSDMSPAAENCNQIAVAGGAESFPNPSDGYGFTAVTCIQMQSIANAIVAVDGTVDQASVIAAMQTSDPLMIAGPAGSLSATKHDAGTSLFLSRYSAATEQFAPVNDQKPITVAS